MSFGIGESDPFSDFGSGDSASFDDWYASDTSDSGWGNWVPDVDFSNVFEGVLSAGLLDLFDIEQPNPQPLYDQYGNAYAYPVNATYPGQTTQQQPATSTNWTPLIVGLVLVLVVVLLFKKIF